MEPSFLQSYLAAFNDIEGWFSFDAALVFMSYAKALKERGIAGDVLEIGVYHGLSAIGVAALRGDDCRFHAVDLFEDQQDKNVSQAGVGHRGLFEASLKRFYPSLDFLRVLPKPSADLAAADFAPRSFSFCHVDGGHSREETFADLSLCADLLMPGGIVAVDDYFNAMFPGVAEGCIQFFFQHPGQLRPLFTGYNKVLFQKLPGPANLKDGLNADLNDEFLSDFPHLKYLTVQMWSLPVIHPAEPLRHYLDLHSSTPQKLVPLLESARRAALKPTQNECTVQRGEEFRIAVVVANTSQEQFPHGEKVFGLSYHLLGSGGNVLRHDNDRTWILNSMNPGDETTYQLGIRAPGQAGSYRLEIDLVWEGVMWFKEAGNPTATVDLHVS